MKEWQLVPKWTFHEGNGIEIENAPEYYRLDLGDWGEFGIGLTICIYNRGYVKGEDALNLSWDESRAFDITVNGQFDRNSIFNGTLDEAKKFALVAAKKCIDGLSKIMEDYCTLLIQG